MIPEDLDTGMFLINQATSIRLELVKRMWYIASQFSYPQYKIANRRQIYLIGL
jgi:hypothetical protein